MKRRFVMGLSSVLIATCISPIFVNAQQNTSQNPSKEELNARLMTRKTKLGTQVTNVQADAIRKNCVAVQQKVATTAQKISAQNQTIVQKHQKQLSRIDKITKNKTTPELIAVKEDYSKQHAALVESVNALNLSLSDIKAIDCVNDVTNFKATLDSARLEAAAVQVNITGLNTMNTGTLREALTQAKAKN